MLLCDLQNTVWQIKGLLSLYHCEKRRSFLPHGVTGMSVPCRYVLCTHAVPHLLERIFKQTEVSFCRHDGDKDK